MQLRKCAGIAMLGMAAALGGVQSQAYAGVAGTVQGKDSVGAPGQLVSPEFTLDFGNALQLVNFSFNWEFDPEFLSFRKDQSSVLFGGHERSLSAFIDHIKSQFGNNAQLFQLEDAVTPSNRRKYDYTMFPSGVESSNFSGEATIRTVFELSAAAPAGYMTEVRFAGNLVDTDENELPFVGYATVQAVPEPQTWMLWLSGVGLLATAVRRARKG